MLAGATAVVLAASPAGAHTGGPVHGLADGALHPLTGLDHLLAMVAVGIVAAVGTSVRRGFAARRVPALRIAAAGGLAGAGALLALA